MTKQSDNQNPFARYSKEALVAYLVEEVFFHPFAHERLKQIERRLVRDRLVERMHEISNELTRMRDLKSRRARRRAFDLNEEFDSVQRRLDRYYKQERAEWKKWEEDHPVARPILPAEMNPNTEGAK